MNFKKRLEYMGAAFIGLLEDLWRIFYKIILPIGMGIGLFIFTIFIGWWGLLVWGVVGLGLYLWYRAEYQYKEDAQTSREIIREKYEMIETLLQRFMLEGKTVREAYSLLTTMIDTYDDFVEYHKDKFGVDNTVRVYEHRVDELIKRAEDAEKAAKRQQEERAAMLKEVGGNGDIYAIEGDLI